MSPHPPKPKKNALSIRLTESAVFLRTDGPSARRTTSDTRDAMLRGLLVLDIVKPTKITSIDVQLLATTSTAWPEGIGARRAEVTEEHKVFNASTVYFQAGKTASAARRTASIGPGVSYSHTLQHELDGDYGEDEESPERTWDNILDGRHPRAQGNVEDAPPSAGVSRANSRTGQATTQQHSTPAELPLTFSRPNRRVSIDGSQLHWRRGSMFEARPGELAPIPPYSPLPPSEEQYSPTTSISYLDSPGLSSAPNSAAHDLMEFRTSLQSSIRGHQASQSQTSSALSLNSIRQQDRSLSRRPSIDEAIPEDDVLSPSAHSTRNSSPARGLSRRRPRSSAPSPTPPRDSPSSSQAPISTPNGLPSPALPSGQQARFFERDPTPSRERGRKGSRFSLSGMPNIFMDVLRSGSPKTSTAHARSMERQRSADASPRGGSTRRGRTMERGGVGVADVELARENEQVAGDAKNKRASGIWGMMSGDKEKEKAAGDGWKEFKTGTYSYPISFSIPSNAPPTMNADYGSVQWKLKASVHRPGAFKAKMTTSREVIIISCPTQEDTEDTENIIVERQWEQQLQYLISISGRAFYVGGTVPVSFTLMPLTKVKVYRVSVFIEERVDYYTHMRRIARTEAPRRFTLLSVKGEGKNPVPILPLESDDVEVLRDSPLFQVVNPEDNLDEMASTLMGPGPWTFHRDLKLPSSCDILKFSNRNRRANIVITHLLKVVMRVERGDDLHVDKAGKKKMFDIVVQTPIQILPCRCNPDWMALPRYCEVFNDMTTAITPSCPCQLARQQGDHPAGFRGALDRMTSRHSTDSSAASAAETSPISSSAMRYRRQTSYNASILQSNSLFERLMSGQESETGEVPPAYDEVDSPSASRPPFVLRTSNGIAVRG